jgi:hypothetical protein
MIRRLCRFAAALCLGIALAGCDNDPTGPTALFTTETYAGNVGVQGSSYHSFATGTLSPTVIRVVSLTPAVSMGLALGTPFPSSTGEVCSVTLGQVAVVVGDTFQVQLEKGTYCVMVFDIGQVAAGTVAYSLTVVHR